MNNETYSIMYYLLPFLGFIITFLAQMYVTSSYSKYKQIDTKKQLKGCEVARQILDKNGLNNVKVNCISGNLTDHYDPRTKTVNLSRDIYNETSVASVSVAAHECGHAIQDKVGYKFMIIRSKLVPVANISTKLGYAVVMLGLIFGLFDLAVIGIVILLGMLLFQLVTLPVEFNASFRAEKQLAELNILTQSETDCSITMLKAAALTYVASLVTTLFQILRLAIMVIGNRRND